MRYVTDFHFNGKIHNFKDAPEWFSSLDPPMLETLYEVGEMTAGTFVKDTVTDIQWVLDSPEGGHITVDTNRELTDWECNWISEFILDQHEIGLECEIIDSGFYDLENGKIHFDTNSDDYELKPVFQDLTLTEADLSFAKENDNQMTR